VSVTYLNGAINSSVTALAVRGFAEFPTVAPFAVLVGSERMTVGAGAGTVNWSSITRGTGGTAAASHSDGAAVYLVSTYLSVAQFREFVQTDLVDDAVQRLLNANSLAIDERAGPPGPIAMTIYPRQQRLLFFDRPIASITSITEFFPDPVGISGVVADATDYRLRDGGRTLERWGYGTHPADWWSSRMEIVYVPVDDTAERVRVLVKLCQLDINRAPGISQTRIGEYMVQSRNEPYDDEREAILASLEPSGMVFA
jgi:hypothetical protein